MLSFKNGTEFHCRGAIGLTRHLAYFGKSSFAEDLFMGTSIDVDC